MFSAWVELHHLYNAHEVGVPITAVRSFDAYVGGCATNVSVGTRRLGLRSALLTGVGTDQVGDFVLNFLDGEGVETRFIPRFADRRTSAVILTIMPPDKFPLTFYRDNCADIGLSVEHVQRAPVGDSRLVFLTGTGLSVEPSRTATMLAAEIASSAGTTALLDLDYRPTVWPSAEAFGVTVARSRESAACPWAPRRSCRRQPGKRTWIVPSRDCSPGGSRCSC